MVAGRHQRAAVAREDRPRQRVFGRVVAQRQRGLEGLGLVHVHRQHRPKDLVGHQLRVRVRRHDHRGLHEPAFAVIIASTSDYFVVIARFGQIDVGRDPAEAGLVDDGAHERVKLLHRTDLDFLDVLDQTLFDLWPKVRRGVQPRSSAALLPLVFKCRADGVEYDGLHIRTAVHKVEVLTPCLAHHSGVRIVRPQVVCDGPPDHSKCIGAPGEMHAREVGMLKDGITE
mmetsp:Transcript_56698/g.94090  ORF Transcript_56698/g.94090 Transcript_56698/m.94090 type:complete len:228 (+) Transcript_56698:675-1358(+)